MAVPSLDPRTLELLRELARTDEAGSAALAALDELLAETAAVRARADALATLLEAAPAERARIDGEITAADREVHLRSRALAEAEAELAAAQEKRDDERLAAARRFVVRTRDALSIAEKQAAASRTEAKELERQLEAVAREEPAVEARADELAGELRAYPRLAGDAGRAPAPGLHGVAAWARTARAALLVAQSGVATERDAVIRQANELGSVALGEPLAAASARVVIRQVESTGGARPDRP